MPGASDRDCQVLCQRFPPGLYLLCGVVGAERFSFYLLSTYLVLYLNERLNLAAEHAVALYGYFLCGSYTAPLIGGKLADSRLGAHLTALIGCGVLFVGYVLLFGEQLSAVYCSLLLICLGSGLFKAGTQKLLGTLPSIDGRQRAQGYSLFYRAVNLAALAAPLVGSMAQRMGWLCVFMLASCGIWNSLSWLVLGRPYLVEAELTIGAEASALEPSTPRAKLRLMLILLAGLVFGAGYMQSHSSLLLWVREHTDRKVGHLEIPVAWFAMAPAALVLLIGPPLSAGFRLLHQHLREPSSFQKIVLGLALACLSFVPLWALSLVGAGHARVSPLWVLACLATLATAELLVPALAPAEIIRLAPPLRTGRWLSYWFLALAAGNMLGGWIHL